MSSLAPPVLLLLLAVTVVMMVASSSRLTIPPRITDLVLATQMTAWSIARYTAALHCNAVPGLQTRIDDRQNAIFVSPQS